MNHHGYYNELRRTYGPAFVEDVKHWKKLGINLEKRKLQIYFTLIYQKGHQPHH